MVRACKVTLKFATENKRRQIRALLEAYRAAVNFYIKSLWKERGGLNKETLARLQRTRLSERFKSQALKQAIEIVVSTKKASKATKKPCSVPVFRGGAMLDAKMVNVEAGEKSFDLVIRLSTFNPGHRIDIPTRQTRVTNKWLGKPGAQFIQGCELTENGIILWVEMPNQKVKTADEGKVVGIDINANKLIVDSDGNVYGDGFQAYRDKVRRRRPGSKGKRRARIERDQAVNRAVNRLPWGEMSAIGSEDLRGIKKGKKKNRGKEFRKAMAPWVHRRVLERVEARAEENRVRFVSVPPAYTSRTCPHCGKESKENRRGERFQCVACVYKGDSDHVGAQNVLARTLATIGSVVSPVPKRKMQ